MGVAQLLVQVLVRLATAIGLTSSVLTVAQAIYNALHPGGVPIDFGAMATQLGHIDSGVTQIENTVNTILANIATNQSAVLAAVGGPQQSGVAVTLPPPPTGYGFTGLGSSDAATVWQYNGGLFAGTSAADLLQDAGIAAESAGTGAALPAAAARYCLLHWDWSDDSALAPQNPAPLVDPLTILPSDASVLSWLNRTTAPYTWTTFQTQIVSYHGLGGGDRWWICTISDLDFMQYKAALFPKAVVEPPLWPGLANVALGASHALATGLTITAPMDGVIVAITAVPPGTGVYDFDGTLSYTFVGALSFVSDNGDQEFPQGLGFQSALYSPKQMVRAAGVKVRTKPGIVGTVTPWTIT